MPAYWSVAVARSGVAGLLSRHRQLISSVNAPELPGRGKPGSYGRRCLPDPNPRVLQTK